jgi:hypothetical protein
MASAIWRKKAEISVAVMAINIASSAKAVSRQWHRNALMKENQ